jgi:hypothetical protein
MSGLWAGRHWAGVGLALTWGEGEGDGRDYWARLMSGRRTTDDTRLGGHDGAAGFCWATAGRRSLLRRRSSATFARWSTPTAPALRSRRHLHHCQPGPATRRPIAGRLRHRISFCRTSRLKSPRLALPLIARSGWAWSSLEGKTFISPSVSWSTRFFALLLALGIGKSGQACPFQIFRNPPSRELLDCIISIKTAGLVMPFRYFFFLLSAGVIQPRPSRLFLSVLFSHGFFGPCRPALLALGL